MGVIPVLITQLPTNQWEWLCKSMLYVGFHFNTDKPTLKSTVQVPLNVIYTQYNTGCICVKSYHIDPQQSRSVQGLTAQGPTDLSGLPENLSRNTVPHRPQMHWE